MTYTLDISKLVTRLLPPILRRPTRIAWIQALLAGVEKVHQKFLTYTDAKWDEVKYTGQVFVMENMLQQKFGAGIRITVTNVSTDTVIGSGNDWSSSVGTGVDVDSTIPASYTGAVQTDFVVHVPLSIVFVVSEMQGYINQYKMFGTTYTINRF